MNRYPQYTRPRLQQFAGKLSRLIYSDKKQVDRLLVSGEVDRISYDAAQTLSYRSAKMGESFGPPWATFWFRAEATIPEAWRGRRVDLLWNSHSEGTLWVDGRTVQGLNFHAGDRPDAILVAEARGAETLKFQIEMACNGKFGIKLDSQSFSLNHYVLDQCDIAVFDPLAWEIYHDFVVLQELEAAIHKKGGFNDRTWGGLLLADLNRFVNEIDVDDRKTWPAAQAILKNLYEHQNGSVVQELSALGHAHIDTAWLWPLAETMRKCERTFSTQTAYMERYPEYTFACFSTFGNIMRMTLLRAPGHPDPTADRGRHDFSYALMPHAGSWQEAGVVAEGYRFNVPPLICNGIATPKSWASVDHPNLVLDTIKRAEDGDDVILRLYEAHGARGEARVSIDLPFARAVFCNILEDELEPATIDGKEIRVPYRPFQIVTLKLQRK